MILVGQRGIQGSNSTCLVLVALPDIIEGRADFSGERGNQARCSKVLIRTYTLQVELEASHHSTSKNSALLRGVHHLRFVSNWPAC